MVDEFGGNYLDGNGDGGAYPTVKESFLRFLGRGHTRAMRTRLHTESNGKIAEYWRRLGAAGYSPFCQLGAPEDGNHWFWGSLKDGRPKPAWDASTAAWSPRAVSLEIWDRNFEPGQEVTLPAYFFNDTGEDAELAARVAVRPEAPVEIPAELVQAKPVSAAGWGATASAPHPSTVALAEQTLTASVKAYGLEKKPVKVALPRDVGRWQIEARLDRAPAGVTRPVVSAWRLRTMTVAVPARLNGVTVGAPEGEVELRAFLGRNGLRAAAIDDPAARVIVTSRETWESLTAGNGPTAALEKALAAGRTIVMLDLGPTPLGQGYGEDLGPLQSAPKPRPSSALTLDLLGVSLSFREVAEPESHLQPAGDDRRLWEGMDVDATWMWNGLRGGLVVPASAMEVIQADPAGVASRLALTVETLATCGRNLTRTPVLRARFAERPGSVILSQLLTAGRLAPGFGQPGLYGIRYDPAAAQFVLNMLAFGVSDRASTSREGEGS
jgi:hypothetical protein